jgi:two-component system, response regulator, stage 0 sporulation protein F
MTTGEQPKPDLEEQLKRHRVALDRLAQAMNNLNNLLTVMRGHAQLAYEDPSEKTVGELIRVVLTSTARMQREIREAFGRTVVEGVVEQTSGPAPARQARILVVDDEHLVRTLMHELLTKNGHTVTSVGTREAALEECKKNDFDIVFMDIRLGKSDGFKVYRQIRELEPETHVVFLSGDPNIENIWQRVRQEGADGFIQKPFDINEISNVVYRLLALPEGNGEEPVPDGGAPE